ncbi:hypothetical protein B7494_g4013 [Chlorociboria aeruginascens]|nr:hypothetical protein B7494_g4013 [Chlorociboria aeruginascens]
MRTSFYKSNPILRIACLHKPEHAFFHRQRRFYTGIAGRDYKDAINLLNTLQTPYEVTKQQFDAGIRSNYVARKELMIKCLAHMGYSQEDLKRLNIVHVAGTKGKGTTCAYVESILSAYQTSHGIPKKIGLFTSPHLIAVRERIRINASTISSDLFTKYFFQVWDALSSPSLSSPPPEIPMYFRFLTLLSYHIFLSEDVDVAVYETGVGGEYDGTNIVESPAVTGITSLGIDHTFSLGETIEEIAWHKAGIQKAGVKSFTVNQVPSAMDIIKKRAEERKVEELKIVGLNEWLRDVNIQPDEDFQKGNASLAIELASVAMEKLDPAFQLPLGDIPDEIRFGLQNTKWRGRCDTKIEGPITWYLDGAHTKESIEIATKWFKSAVQKRRRPTTKILIFNQQGNRESISLLIQLHAALKSKGLENLDLIIFCPSLINPLLNPRPDFINHQTSSTAISSLELQREFRTKWLALSPSFPAANIQVTPYIDDALASVHEISRAHPAAEIQVFVTGSLHLVGSVLGCLEDTNAL